MMLQVQHWELNLLALAHAALDSGVSSHGAGSADLCALDDAYDYCRDMTRENSKTFYLASSLMPGEKRRATQALYAFCRVSDDLVDRPTEDRSIPPGALLATWRDLVVCGHTQQYGPLDQALPAGRQVSLAWADARRKFGIPRGYVEQLVDGLAQDLTCVRYETFTDLARYCYGAACTVGLMSMHISGYSGREAIPYAIRLGVALQLTNILRDVGDDWRSGRLYLPREELEAFHLSEEDIAVGVNEGLYDQRWRDFMRFQLARARRLYADALPGIALLHPDGRFAIAAAGELYRAILDQIESSDYNVFTHRAAVGAWGKLSRLPGIWWRARTAKAA